MATKRSNFKPFSQVPSEQGLYNPQNEHDACGVAMVATLRHKPSHDIVEKGLTALRNLDHRGASGAEPDSGDGAGILICQPDKFFREILDFKLPSVSKYAAGIIFIDNKLDENAIEIGRAHV